MGSLNARKSGFTFTTVWDSHGAGLIQAVEGFQCVLLGVAKAYLPR